jgi:hypothetical protein
MAPKESRFRTDSDSDGWLAGSVVFNAMMAKPTDPRKRSGAGVSVRVRGIAATVTQGCEAQHLARSLDAIARPQYAAVR